MTLKEEFDVYVRMCYPQGISAEQREDLERTFFAGVVTLWRQLSEGENTDEVNAANADRLDNEIRAYREKAIKRSLDVLAEALQHRPGGMH